MLANTFVADRPLPYPEPEAVPAGITLSEAAKTLRDLSREKANSQRVYSPDEAHMLDLAIAQNREFIERLRPTTLGEFYDKYSIKFRFPEFKLPELKFDFQNMLGKVLLHMPRFPGLPLTNLFENLNLLKLDLPRNILQMEMMKRINKFKVTDISPSFDRYLRETRNPVFFMTDPIYERQVDAETLAPSDNVSKRRVKIGGADIFAENRSLTLKARRLKQSDGKMYLPIGLIYSDDVEKDDLSGLVPTRVEIVTRNGKTIIPPEMTMVSNGQIYVNYNQKVKFSEVRIIYGKPSPDHIARNLQLCEEQEDQNGLANEANLTEEEATFRRFLVTNKTVEEGSKQSQEGSLNKILKYMKNQYLRYSVLDTIKSGKKISNARRALQYRRTSCLGSACVAKTFIDTYKFTPGLKTRSGILGGFIFDYEDARQNASKEDEFPINMDKAHAVTIAQFGNKIRIYDITPETKSKPQRVEGKIKNYIQNTNRVYRAIKQIFVKDDPRLYPEYKKNHRQNLYIYKNIKREDFRFEGSLFTQNVINQTLSNLLHRCMTQRFSLDDSLHLRDHEALGFPFSLIARLKSRHKEHEDLDLSPSARNNAENAEILRFIGLNLGDGSILRRFIPVSRDAMNIWKMVASFKDTTPNLMAALISYQKSLTEYLDRVALMKELNQRSNMTLRDMLLGSEIPIDEDAFSKISWLDLIFTGELYELRNDMYGWLEVNLRETFSPDEVLSTAEKQLSEAEGMFNGFVREKSREIRKIFTEPTHSMPPAPERIISSTLLFMNVDSSQRRLTEKEKKVEVYRKIKVKVGNLFYEYYQENKLKEKLTTATPQSD